MCSWSDFSASFNVVIYGVSLQNIKKWAVRIDFDHEIHLLNTFQNRPFKEKNTSHITKIKKEEETKHFFRTLISCTMIKKDNIVQKMSTSSI